ncbi:MAG: chemotaxis protein CheW [Marinisporobacter sp.]|jgi:purine-binding chemotaxis protein CheW|nr:chemotaxis protein CheW [Marinisporobacter sp.]
MKKSNTEEKIEILEFLLKNEEEREKYAIEVSYTNEVYSVNCVTMLPCTPSFVIGIVNFRGKIISVIDMRNFLGFTTKKINANEVKKIITIKENEMEVGIAVEEILGCKEIFTGEIQENIVSLTNLNKDYFKGMIKTGSIILDIKNIIMDKKIIVDEEVV